MISRLVRYRRTSERFPIPTGRRTRVPRRIANRLLQRGRDCAQGHGHGTSALGSPRRALGRLEGDEGGLDGMDRKILRAIAVTFEGGPVGLTNLAAAISEESDTIEEVYEPYLIQQGLLQRTARGRIVTARGLRHLGATHQPLEDQAELF